MTETRFITEGSPTSCVGNATGHSLRKRKASNASFLDPEFLAFLRDTGVLDSLDEDPSIAELLRNSSGQSLAAEAMNDLPGALSFVKQEQPEAEPVLSETLTRETAASQLSGLSCQHLQQQQQQQATSYTGFHRAVITAMPLPAPASRGAAAAAGAAAEDDDTNSAATLPMPNKRRCTDDDEVTSSPNDLVEVPSTTVITTASGTAATTATSRPAAGRDAAAAPDQVQQAPQRQQQQQQQAQAGSSCKSAAAADGAVVKAILVAKVLTKSDANSKRIILPRIAVEANLPQLSHAQVFNFSATDPSGSSWPLVIKAWANGQNPKPVYVLEQIGELLKQYKLTTGDAVALMASEDGRFFLEWNTDAARAAAARPTYSAFTFKQQAAQQQQQPPAAPARGKAAAKQQQQRQQAALQEQQPSQQQQQQKDQQQVLGEQQPVVVKAEPQPAQQQQQPAQQQQQPVTPVKVEQQPQLRCGPLMTAIPVTSAPMISGTFIPTSPCQLLVMNSDNPLAAMQLDDPLLPALSPAMLMLKTRSDAAFELPEPVSLAPPAAACNTADGGEEMLVPVVPEAGENGALHAGGFLLCPRTPGCTRPAGHQGWCLGHKGYKKRRT